MAVGVALPFWAETALRPPEVNWANALVAVLTVAYAALAWFAVLNDRDAGFWHGSTLATTRWTSVAGFSVLPTIVLGVHGAALGVVVLGVAASVAFLSPELSHFCARTVDHIIGPERTVPPSERAPGTLHELMSSWEAVRLCPPGTLVPPCWHPCLGRPSKVLTEPVGPAPLPS